MHILVKAFVKGVGHTTKRGKYEERRVEATSTPNKVREFTASEFNQLSQLMGGCEVKGASQTI